MNQFVPGFDNSITGACETNMVDALTAVTEYYGKVISSSKDFIRNACSISTITPHREILRIMRSVPNEIILKFNRSGGQLPLGISGLRVLDLGSGSGRDSYICSALVGEKGSVTGVDTDDEQLAIANKYVKEYTKTLEFAKPNMKFIKGKIDCLDKAGIRNESVDMVVSTGALNQSPDKSKVLKEVYRVLAPGGEFHFSEVFCDRRLPEHVKKHELVQGECISGALYIEDFKKIAYDVGFPDTRVLSVSDVNMIEPELEKICGAAKFHSVTYRLFKVPELMERLCEDYGQIATYKGTIPGHENEYQLDDRYQFEKGKPVLVCGNTAAMLGEKGTSWLAPHFDIVGDRSRHYGLFKRAVGGAHNHSTTGACASFGSSCCF